MLNRNVFRKLKWAVKNLIAYFFVMKRDFFEGENLSTEKTEFFAEFTEVQFVLISARQCYGHNGAKDTLSRILFTIFGLTA